MDSAAKESILPDRLSERLGGLISKDEQRLALVRKRCFSGITDWLR